MDNSDDYFGDDFDLDEEALSSIQKTEAQLAPLLPTPATHAVLASKHTIPALEAPRPKRQKTTSGWLSTGAAADLNDPPNLDVTFDERTGSYVTGPVSQKVPNPLLTPLHSQSNAFVATSHTANRPVDLAQQRLKASSGGSAGPVLPRDSSSTSTIVPSGAGPSRNTSSSSSTVSSSRKAGSDVTTRAHDFHLGRDRTAEPAVSAIKHDRATAIELELENMKKRFEQMQTSNDMARKALKEAEEARFVKDGEVSNLRRLMDQRAAEHTAEVQKLKDQKIAAEHAREQMQQELAAEMDRMKTRLAFKQHDLESLSLQQGSSRPKNRYFDQPRASLAPPSSLNLPHAKTSSPSSAMPNRRTTTPKGPSRTKDFKSPKESISNASFPHFKNAFEPPRFLSPSKKKDLSQIPETSLVQDHRSSDADPLPVEMASSSPVTQGANLSPDISRIRTQADEDDDDERSTDDADSRNDWWAEAINVLFSHSLDSVDSLTIQSLISATFPCEINSDLRDLYTRSCSCFLKAAGARNSSESLDESFEEICRSLVGMAAVLVHLSDQTLLTQLFSLLSTLILYVPLAKENLMYANGDAATPLITTIIRVILSHLTGLFEIGENKKEKCPLANETLFLLECLCWNTSEGILIEIGYLVRKSDVLESLLNAAYPEWFTIRAIRLLVLLATHETMFRPLLAPPLPEPDGTTKNKRAPYIERLCTILVDSIPSMESQKLEILQSVIAFFSVLSVAHPDAKILLQEFPSLIPSLVTLMCSLSDLIWEEDEDVLASSDYMLRVVRTMHYAALLAHHLTLSSPDSDSDRDVATLSNRIFRAGPGFQGVVHSFVVGIGRLSYAAAPEWMAADARRIVESTSELAHALMEVVFEGPEEDMIWSAYNDGDDETRSVGDSDNDDEAEASKLAPDEDEFEMQT